MLEELKKSEKAPTPVQKALEKVRCSRAAPVASQADRIRPPDSKSA